MALRAAFFAPANPDLAHIIHEGGCITQMPMRVGRDGQDRDASGLVPRSVRRAWLLPPQPGTRGWLGSPQLMLPRYPCQQCARNRGQPAAQEIACARALRCLLRAVATLSRLPPRHAAQRSPRSRALCPTCRPPADDVGSAAATKLACTIGPVSNSVEALTELLEAGMTVRPRPRPPHHGRHAPARRALQWPPPPAAGSRAARRAAALRRGARWLIPCTTSARRRGCAVARPRPAGKRPPPPVRPPPRLRALTSATVTRCAPGHGQLPPPVHCVSGGQAAWQR